MKCWNGGRVISTSHFLQIKIPGWAGPRSPWHREYPRHREQLILSQARCGDVTCRLSRVTCHTMAGGCPRVTLVITSHKPILCLCNEYDCPSNDGRGSTTRSQETNIRIPREAEITEISQIFVIQLVPQIDPSVPQPVIQSRRRPLLWPSPSWKRLLALSHLRHY